MDSEKTSELDMYGVWVKKPPRDAENEHEPVNIDPDVSDFPIPDTEGTISSFSDDDNDVTLSSEELSHLAGTADIIAADDPAADTASILDVPEADIMAGDLPVAEEPALPVSEPPAQAPDLGTDDLAGLELPDDIPDTFDEETALFTEPDAPAAEPEPAAPAAPADNSMAILLQIQKELSSLRSEITTLKQDFTELKKDRSNEPDTIDIVPDIPEISPSGFFDEPADDEDIALSTDELNKIVSNADFTEAEPVLDAEPVDEPEVPAAEPAAPVTDDIPDSDISFDDLPEIPDLEDSLAGLDTSKAPIPENAEELLSAPVPESSSILDDELYADDTPLDTGSFDIDFDASVPESDIPEPVVADDFELDSFGDDVPSDTAAKDILVEPATDDLIGPDEAPAAAPAETPVEAELPDFGDLPEAPVDDFVFDEPAAEALPDAPAPAEDEPLDAQLPPMPELDAELPESPIADIPAVEVPADEPAAAPAAELPELDDFALDEPVIEEPVIDEPVIEEPVIEAPADDLPALDDFALDEPVIEEPVIEEPVIDEPVLEEPTDEPAAETAAPAAPVEPAAPAAPAAGTDTLPPDLTKDIKSVLSYMDRLLENLPDEKIAEFARSPQFAIYKKLFTELGLA